MAYCDTKKIGKLSNTRCLTQDPSLLAGLPRDSILGHMTQEGRLKAAEIESPDDEEKESFKDFIKGNQYTADQMREAYERLVGVNDDEEYARSCRNSRQDAGNG